VFEYNSAALTPTAREQLDQLAQALTAPGLSEASFRIEGHTDAVGSADYNLRLSQERALAVVDYLADHGVSRARLQAIGKGKSELLPSLPPDAAENRRVKVINLSS
jgi:outer membrane protein OmpA-like peptidoglycan-associated protein